MCKYDHKNQDQPTRQHTHHHHNNHNRQKKTFWLVGLASLLWLALRSGTNPRRLAYPCQRAALANSAGFLGYLASALGLTFLYRRFKRRPVLPPATFFALMLALLVLLGNGRLTPQPVSASLPLPQWTSETAVSNIFVISDIPAPPCSLDGGALPVSAPCNDPAYALSDSGVDALIAEMENQSDYFFKTAVHPNGIVGADDVVVIKINNQWAGYGEGSSEGRFTTSTDTTKGLIWRILQHPDSFSGEIVIAENTQWNMMDWDFTPANAQDQNQSFQDVAGAFQNQGYPVSLYLWDDLNENLVRGGNVGDDCSTGEYADGDMGDAYVLLEDNAASGEDELSYPKFRTAAGNFISMRCGVWDGSRYDSERLTFINAPVLKRHGMAGSTIAWKNLIGFVTIADTERRYGDWDEMHDFYWGYTEGRNSDYGLIGRTLALVGAPDLNLVDAIWIATEDNTGGPAVRQNTLLASRDPFAVDWYASEYVLRPVSSSPEDASAARYGVFRDATRVNQNAAAAVWPGTYPYLHLLDTCDGDAPCEEERNQLNVYHPGGTVPETAVAEPPPTKEAIEEAPEIEESAAAEQASAPAPALGMLADFEGGAESWEADGDGEGTTAVCAADPNAGRNGGTALHVDFDIVEYGWGGCDTYYDDAQNWSDAPGISFRMRVERAESNIGVTVFSGEAWTPYQLQIVPAPESVGKWTLYTFRWQDFTLVEWADEDAPANLDPASIVSYGFSADEEAGQTVFWVDDISLMGEDAPGGGTDVVAPELTEPSETAVPAEEPAPEKTPGGQIPCVAAALAPAGLALVGMRRWGRKRPFGA